MRPTDNFKKFNDSQRHALDTRRNLAVRANAGSGKTSVLVERIAQLLAQSWDDKKPLDLTQIVAITFTRKAAAELEERLRSTFREMASLTADPAERDFWAARTEELPRAMIGTIDSFCARILREFGLLDPAPDRIEPDFEALEGYEAELLKKEAIDRLIDDLASEVSNDPGSSTITDQIEARRWWSENEGYYALTKYLMELLDHPVEPKKIVEAHRDLPSPADRVRAAWENLPAVQALKKDRAALIDELQSIMAKVEGIDNQTLKDLHERVRQALVGFRRSEPDSVNAGLESLRDALFTLDSKHSKPRSLRSMKEVEDELTSLQEKWCPLLESFGFDFDAEARALDAADKLALLLGPAYERYLALCREANQYDFWTVARKTRDLLARDPAVRSELRHRYRYVMVDEFQDTNQLQWEIISWIVGNGPDGPLDKDRLFIVGDPQQSIYRFRKADVSVFSRVQEKIQEANRRHKANQIPTVLDSQQPSGSFTPEQRLGIIPLRENYRSLKPMPLELMDHVFQYVFDLKKHGLDPERKFEIQYQNLIPGVDCNAVGEVRYVVLGDADNDFAAEDESDAEGAPVVQDLAGRQVQAVIDQLASLRGQPKHIIKDGEENTLSWRDMAILLPSRDVVLGKLEKELARRRIPYVVTSGIGFWQRQEVRDVVSLACFLADAGDELALFAVLRGPAGQLGDREILFLSQLGRGRILRGLRLLLNEGESPEQLQTSEMASREDEAPTEPSEPGCVSARRQAPESISEPLRTVLGNFWTEMNVADRARLRQVASRLNAWRKRVDRMAHSDLLQRCLEESGAYAIYAAEAEGELILANLRRLFERIRAEESRSAAGMARLARWMRAQVDDALRDEQAVLAAGQDAAQIMTVHAAKGLEFPVVAVMKMERKVDRSQSSRLLVKSEWDALLKRDEQESSDARPGTLAVVVRHPLRPRETYTPRLLKALRDLEKAQELAESRRLFYVAATRAKERLILAGRQPRQKKDGASYQLPESWKKWFEDALHLGEEHKQNGAWEDPVNHFKIRILTDVSPDGEKMETPSQPIPNRFCLDYVHERTRSPSIAATGLESMRETWRQSPHEWWLRYRVKVRPHMPKAISKSEIQNPKTAISDLEIEILDSEENLGTVIGTLVHRLFETGPEALRTSKQNRHALLQAMAANILASSQLPNDPDGEEESAAVASPILASIVSSVERLVDRISGEKGTPLHRLLEAQGESEVEFLLNLGGWHITGRFDKLIPNAIGGYEIVDWKTDRESDWQEIVERYRENQMRLYALALHRSGRAALLDGEVQVHLALLHHGRVETLHFPLQELETFADDLEMHLQEMEQFGE